MNSQDVTYTDCLLLDGTINVAEIESILRVTPQKTRLKDCYGDTPLIVAASSSNKVDVCNVLLKYGSDIDDKNDYSGNTALHNAIEKGHYDVVAFLIAHNANIEDKKYDSDTCMHIACEHNHIRIVELLLENNSNVNVKGQFDKTPLHLACSTGNIDIVTLLLNRSADVNANDCDGTTPCMIACNEGYRDIVRLLINRGASVNDADNNGDTAMHFACYHGHSEIVTILLDKQAQYQVKNKTGYSPFLLACQGGYKDIALTLIYKGSNITESASDGNTALHCSMLSNNEELVMTLIDIGLNIHALKNNNNQSPLDMVDDDSYIKKCVLSYIKQVDSIECDMEAFHYTGEILCGAGAKSTALSRIYHLECLLSGQRDINAKLLLQVDNTDHLRCEISALKCEVTRMTSLYHEEQAANASLKLQQSTIIKDSILKREELSILKYSIKDKEDVLAENAVLRKEVLLLKHMVEEVRQISRDKEISLCEEMQVTRDQTNQFKQLLDKKLSDEMELLINLQHLRVDKESLMAEVVALKDKCHQQELLHTSEVLLKQGQIQQLQELLNLKAVRNAELEAAMQDSDVSKDSIASLWCKEVQNNEDSRILIEQLREQIVSIETEVIDNRKQLLEMSEHQLSLKVRLTECDTKEVELSTCIHRQIGQLGELRSHNSILQAEADNSKQQLSLVQAANDALVAQHQREIDDLKLELESIANESAVIDAHNVTTQSEYLDTSRVAKSIARASIFGASIVAAIGILSPNK